MNRITGYQSNFHFSINITHLQYHFGTKRTKGLLLSIFNKYHPSTCLTFHSIPNMEEKGDPSLYKIFMKYISIHNMEIISRNMSNLSIKCWEVDYTRMK